ncbi:MAG TPA: hypothetical protein EYM25_04225 [Deltaproteobacteria bacterium]|nr:hypothetical protein [Deltaproteobacteria bacterium]
MRTTDLSLLWKLRKRKSKSHYRTKGRVPKWGVVWLTGCWLLAGAEVAHADFFKWEVLVYPEGWGTAYVTFPVTNEGVVYKTGSRWLCHVEAFWTRIESELLRESKTLRCVQGNTERTVRVICTDNNRNRRYNTTKEDYASSVSEGFPLDPEQGARSPYLLLRCFF